jgi:diguanylate cyclase (GGDEF)-like protein
MNKPVPTAIDHLAALTGYRDRDLLDVTLAHALMDLLTPWGVAVYKLVGEEGEQCWLLRARLSMGQPTAVSDPPWIGFDGLPERNELAHLDESLRTQTVIVVPAADEDDPQALTTTVFPLVAEGDALGVVEVQSTERLTAGMKRTVCSILRIYRNFHGLLDYSERDTLTGLLNRKTFDEAFLKTAHEGAVSMGESEGDRRHGGAGPVKHWLGVVDIDHFKQVNDRFGHLIGDEVLLLVARILRSTFRFQDRLYRFGGEEFVVLLRCTDEADAAHAFERLRANMEAYVFPQVGHVTASVGFTQVLPGDAPSGAFERADRAVYYAKQNGRNRVCGHEALVREGKLRQDDKVGDVELF